MRLVALAMVAVVAGSSLADSASATKLSPVSDKTLSQRCGAAGGEMMHHGVCYFPDSGVTIACGGSGKKRACNSTAITTSSGGTTTEPIGPATGLTHPIAPNPSGVGNGPSLTISSKPTSLTGGVISTH